MNKNRRLLIVSLSLPILMLVLFVTMARLASSAPIQVGDDTAVPAVVQTTFLVTTIADSDDGTCDADCSLREAIAAANAAPGVDLITFSLPDDATIILGGSQLPIITDTLTIDGSKAVSLTVSGDSKSRVLEIGSGAAVTLTSLIVADGNVNTTGNCPTNCGGGIFNSGRLSIFNSTIISNVAYVGAGISNEGTMTISHSTLYNNSAANGLGGGIYNIGPLDFINSTLSANWAGTGGGIFNDNVLTINNSTLHLNGAITGYGGGIRNNSAAARLNFSNSIVSNPIHGSTDCETGSGTIGTNINNLVEDGSCSATFSGNPLLGPLKDNGGATWTHVLLPDSPAIDTGNDDSCEATDQRGESRPQDGNIDGTATCDIGAVEMPAEWLVFLPAVIK